MDSYQATVVAKYREEIICCIERNLSNAIYDFAKDGAGPSEMRILTKRDIDAIRTNETPYSQTVNLIRVLKARENGFKALTTALRHYGRENLARTLEEDSCKGKDTAHALWNAALRMDDFVGREDILQQLEELQDGAIGEINKLWQSTQVLAVCVGLGGVGKSSIALEFMYRNSRKYKRAIWVPATTCEGIENCLAQLGEQLSLPASNGKSVMWTDTVSWLQANPGWLIVFDDAPNPRLIQSYMPRTGGHVLVSSRYTAWRGYKTVDITPFNEEETRQYLKRVLPFAINETDGAVLAEALGSLPLAIAQATAYMSILEISVQDYMVIFRTAQRRLLSKVLPPDCEFTPVYITWNISLEKATSQCNFAADLLAFCSLLDHNYIPDTLIREYAKKRNCLDILADAQAALFSYSLMKIKILNFHSSRGMSMHTLVQLVTKSNLSIQKMNDYIDTLCICITDTWPNDYQRDHDTVRDLYTSVEQCWNYVRLDTHTYKNNTTHVTLNIQLKILNMATAVYHIFGNSKKEKETLTNVLPILETLFGPNHVQVAITLGNLGNAYGSVGDYQKQKDLLERALSIEEKHYGPDHVDVACTLNNLGNAHGSIGDYQKKKDLLERALAIKEKHYGPDHVDVASTLGNLGNAYGSIGDYQKKKDLLERALAIEEKHYGLDHAIVAKTLGNLSNAYSSIGDYQKQKDLLEQALATCEKHYGPDHVEVAKTLGNLSNAYGSIGDYQKQKDLLERALAIKEKHYGPDHVEVARTLGDFGNAYGDIGDYQKQKNFLQRALAIQEKHYGPNHVEVARTLGNLGNAYGDLGDYQKQKDFLQRALAIEEKHYGPDHVEVAKTLENLSNAYGSLGDYQKRKNLLEQAVAIKEKHYGPHHVEVAKTLGNLGNAYGDIGNYQKRKNLLEQALAIEEKHYGPHHVEVAKTLGNLGNAYGSIGDYQKQKDFLQRALSIEEKHYGPNHVEVAKTLGNISNAYGRIGDYRKQMDLLERALATFEKHYGPDHVEVGRTLGNLGNACGSMGDYQKQIDLLERELATFEKHYGTNHIEVARTLCNHGNAYGRFGDYQKQKDLLERALAIFEKHYGPDHEQITSILWSLSHAYGSTGSYIKEEVLLEKLFLILEKKSGQEVVVYIRKAFKTYQLVRQTVPVLRVFFRANLFRGRD